MKVTKRKTTVADFHAGKASMQDVANLAGFVKENSWTLELMQAAEKVQQLRQEGKNDVIAAALKEYDVLAEQAVAQRLALWKRELDARTTPPLTDKV